eukprot:1930398-Rhodomonas_salina.1
MTAPSANSPESTTGAGALPPSAGESHVDLPWPGRSSRMQLCRSWSERQHTHDVGALLSAQQASATSNEQRAAQQQKKSALCMCTTAQKSEGNTPRADLEAFDEREPVLLAAHEAVEEEHGRLGR